MVGGMRIWFSWAVEGQVENQIRVGCLEHRLSATLIKSLTERLLWAGRGRLGGYNGMLFSLDISCNKSYSIAGPGFACTRSLSCSARCKAQLNEAHIFAMDRIFRAVPKEAITQAVMGGQKSKYGVALVEVKVVTNIVLILFSIAYLTCFITFTNHIA